MVSCGEGSRRGEGVVKEIYPGEVKKLCSGVGFEQRCIVRREEA